ncbi:hypothetical protein HAX54_051541 [Datura stramonium]|uniref:Uncharacterized protein n=1 Tax=Datura stramonium TaxID=4076 RepID=A0ABS8RRC0_DATST|nr:hypothetical protein [Datura stramonium]
MFWKKRKSKVESEFPLVKWLTKDFRGVRFVESDLEYLFKNLDPVVAIIAEKEDEVIIPVYDQDTGANHIIKLQKDADGVFGLYEDWIERVAQRRGFEGNELIGFYVNRLNLELTFSVPNLNRKIMKLRKRMEKKKMRISAPPEGTDKVLVDRSSILC